MEVDTKWGGLRNLVGGEGGFLLRASGQGKIVVSTYGALDRFELQPGQQVVVDTNHMVAFSESVQMELRRASDSLLKSAKTGEGFVFVFTGPGELMMQSRNPDDIVTGRRQHAGRAPARRLADRLLLDQLVPADAGVSASRNCRVSPPTSASCTVRSASLHHETEAASTCSAI